MRVKLGLVLFIFALVSLPLLFPAQTTIAQDLNVTTYFLPPNATYMELRAQKLGVGPTYYNTTVTDITAGTSLIVENRVGIRTWSPRAELEVAGYVRMNSLGTPPAPPSTGLVCWKDEKTLGLCTGNVQQNGKCDCQ